MIDLWAFFILQKKLNRIVAVQEPIAIGCDATEVK